MKSKTLFINKDLDEEDSEEEFEKEQRSISVKFSILVNYKFN